MFDLALFEITFLLLVLGGFIAGMYLAVRLARRPPPPSNGD